MGTLRPCCRLAGETGTDIRLVPISASEDRIVRRLRLQGETESFDGIAGNFTVVIIDGGTIGNDDNSALVAEAADRIVLVTQAARLSHLQISRALAALGAPDDKFGGAICNDLTAKAAA
jgi:hypothetical protein